MHKNLKERFKEKLEKAKELRREFGDPITLAKGIIEISEDKLDEFNGFKYVNKKF